MTDKFIEKLIKYIEKNDDIVFSFDLDDTLTETARRVIDYANKHPQASQILKDKDMFPLNFHDVTDFFIYREIFGDDLTHELFSFISLYDENLGLKEGALEFFDFVKEHFGQDKIRVVTASFEGVEDAKDDFISNTLNIDKSQIIHASDKTVHVKSSIYFDDGFHNLKPLLDCDETLTVCMRTPWNKKELEDDHNLDYSIDNFHEALAIFQRVVVELERNRKKTLKKKKRKSNSMHM